MRPCPYCEHRNPEGVRRCGHCGAEFEMVDDRSKLHEAAPPDDELEEEIRSLLNEDRKIEAIKVYRAARPSGLKEAKEAVEALQRGQRLPEFAPPTADEAVLLALLRQGQKISAVKLQREQTGSGLKEAKDVVEALASRHGIASPKAGCASALALLALLAGGAGILTTVF